MTDKDENPPAGGEKKKDGHVCTCLKDGKPCDKGPDCCQNKKKKEEEE